MNKKISLGSTLALMLITAALTVSITMVLSMRMFNNEVYNVSDRATMYNKLAALDSKVRQNYFGEIDETTLLDSLARGYIAGLEDQYSSYFTADQYTRMSNNLSGKTVGIGAKVTEYPDGNLYVYRVLAGTPAESAGIQVGDLITTIDDQVVQDMGASKAEDALVGNEGSKIKLSVSRGGETFNFEIVRVRYDNQTVFAEQLGSIGYIQIEEFNDTTANQFTAAVDNLVNGGVTGLIFDVRDNPGGTLESVSHALDHLLPEGPIVSSTDKEGNTKVLYESDDKSVSLPMMVLTNEKSASAAELFASALRDYDMAKLVGVKTYGKGSMQKFFALDDGSGVDITIARFNPPKSENFEGKGLEPDYKVELEGANQNIHLLTDETDSQLQAAMSLLTGKTPNSESDASAGTVE
ncbi:MAG: S41 family peptidase [Clostridiales bacterium]|nr:S41 family peptidase [Clostridiales bacterium]